MSCQNHKARMLCRPLPAWKVLCILCMILAGCAQTTEITPDVPFVETTPYVSHYGVVYPFPEKDWDESKRPAIREHLIYLHSLGINTVVQVFTSKAIETGSQKSWLIFLDEAQQVGIQVIARLYPSNEENGTEFNYQTIDEFLSIVQDHPALLAYLGLHEPLEQYNSEQLQGFYRHIKSINPNIRVANYMADMAWFDANPRFPRRHFTTEICDICIIWHYPSMFQNNNNFFDLEHLERMVRVNRTLVDERSPESELWFLGQAHSNLPDGFRVPTTAEMETMFEAASRAGVDGFLWYAWLHDQYDIVLGDPEMEMHRQTILTIYEHYLKDKYEK